MHTQNFHGTDLLFENLCPQVNKQFTCYIKHNYIFRDVFVGLSYTRILSVEKKYTCNWARKGSIKGNRVRKYRQVTFKFKKFICHLSVVSCWFWSFHSIDINFTLYFRLLFFHKLHFRSAKFVCKQTLKTYGMVFSSPDPSLSVVYRRCWRCGRRWCRHRGKLFTFSSSPEPPGQFKSTL